MRLELAEFPVSVVRFSKRTAYEDGVLDLDKEELVKLVLRDSRIASADLDIVLPGEQTRVCNTRDVVEPRVKVSGVGCVFPGILGPPETVGHGITHRLSGMTVITSGTYCPTITAGTAAQNTAILDMWGPGAAISPFASTINIILIVKLIESVTEWEAHTAIQLSEFRLATRLAETTRNKLPADVEVFELGDVDPSLPSVVYILGSMTNLYEPHSHVAYYGMPIHESLPTLMHPNELLDGALTTDTRRANASYQYAWDFLNPPAVLGLLREHGRRVNFLGVILQRTRFETEFGKHVSATCTSQLAKLVGADSAIITRVSCSGNNFVDTMLTLKACEQKGIRTVLVTPELGGAEGTDLPLPYYVPEATAVISTGSYERDIKLPVPDKVIGVERGEMARIFMAEPPFDPWGEVRRDGWRDILGGIDWFGGMRITCKEY